MLILHIQDLFFLVIQGFFLLLVPQKKEVSSSSWFSFSQFSSETIRLEAVFCTIWFRFLSSIDLFAVKLCSSCFEIYTWFNLFHLNPHILIFKFCTCFWFFFSASQFTQWFDFTIFHFCCCHMQLNCRKNGFFFSKWMTRKVSSQNL